MARMQNDTAKHLATSVVTFMRNLGFTRRGQNHVSEELLRVLPQKRSWEFADLFDAVLSSLRSRNRGNAGKEILRLRVHEQLRRLVLKGFVTKIGREYHPVSERLATL